MGLKMGIFFEGSWGAAVTSLRWIERKLPTALDKAVKGEAKFMADLFKKELRSGGNPPFAPISEFTKAVRKAQGVRSRKSGIASRQVLRGIKTHKLRKGSYFAGVKKGTPHKTFNTQNDAADMARFLELGRPKVILELDKPGRSGKTPRQFLWWLYLQDAIKNPPNKQTTHMVMKEAPARPFVSQVVKRERKKIPLRIMARCHKEFLTVRLPAPVHGMSALRVPPWR